MNLKTTTSAVTLAALLLVTSAFLNAQNPNNNEAEKKPLALGKFRITPVDLFPGDLKRLKPHLEMDGACFQIEYDGPKQEFEIVTEFWETGGKKRRGGVSTVTFEGPSTAEASISVKKMSDDKGQAILHVISHFTRRSQTGSASGTQTMPMKLPKDAHASGTQGIDEVGEFGSEKEIALWCTVRTTGRIGLSVPIDELVKSVDFAVVLKLVPVND